MSECSSQLNICDHTRSHSIDVIDLFCGVGGLTHGLETAGLNVRLGVDVDPACAYPYEHNNKASFLLKSVEDLTCNDLSSYRNDGHYLLLAGCAPCQPFSTYQRRKGGPQDKRWHLLNHFKRLIGDLQPDFVTMENVPRLVEQDIFKDFVKYLESKNFYVHFSIVNCCDYAVPQNRKRLVLLASKLGKIKLITPFVSPDHYITVRQAIGALPKIKDGEISNTDPLHQSAKLSPLNRKRIQASTPGGSWKDWDKGLVAACHIKDSGKSYPSVYGRMTWDDSSPTITTQYYGFGNGRFGHPEQDRALSLREGAILQSFPPNYVFTTESQQIRRKTIGRLIGNAVPVNLGKAIGESIKLHVANYCNRKNQ